MEDLNTELLKPWNCSQLTSIENVIYSERNGQLKLYIYKDTHERHRVVLLHVLTGKNISGLLFDEYRELIHNYTLPEHEGNHYETHLFAFLLVKTGKRFKWIR